MKEIVSHFAKTFGVDNINWSTQMMICKKLLKQHTKEEIMYAIDYFAARGVELYSLGYLNHSMDSPCRELKAKKETTTWGEDSGSRNQRKFAENNQTRRGTKYNFDLFEKPGQDN